MLETLRRNRDITNCLVLSNGLFIYCEHFDLRKLTEEEILLYYSCSLEIPRNLFWCADHKE